MNNSIPFPTRVPREDVQRSEIHCRFSTATMQRLEEIAAASGQHLNKTVAILVNMILPYVEVREVTEPHKKVFVNLPEGGTQA